MIAPHRSGRWGAEGIDHLVHFGSQVCRFMNGALMRM
jgi:hypothetical protein